VQISSKLTGVIAAIVLTVGVVGLVATSRLQALAEDSAKAEAKIVAQTIADLIVHAHTGSGTMNLGRGAGLERYQSELQTVLDRIFAIRKHDLEIVDTDRKIIADADGEDSGKIFRSDPNDEVPDTLRDGTTRTFVEIESGNPKPRRQAVAAIRAEDGTIVGALIFEFTPQYNELVGLTRVPTNAVIAITGLGLILALGVGLFLSRKLTRRLERLRDAVVDLAGGNFDVRVESDSRDEIGELAGAFNTMVTERKRATEELHESELRFRQLAEHIREVFYLVNADNSQVLYVSPAYEDVWGRSCASLYAAPRSWTDAIHPDDRARISDFLERQKESGGFEYEYRIVRPDGTQRSIRARGFAIRDDAGKVRRFAGIAEDFTERAQLQEALLEGKAGLKRAQHIAKLAHVITAPDGAFETWSETLPQLIGLDPSRMIKSIREWLGILHPDDRAALRAKFIEAEIKGTRTNIEYRLRRADGAWIQVRQVMEPLEGRAQPDGKTHWFNTFQDVTEQNRIAEELRESRQRLEGIVTSAMDGIVTVNEEKCIVLANSTTEKMFGYTAAELLGQPLNMLLPERFRTEHLAQVVAFGNTGATSRRMGALRPVRGLRKNGEEFPIEASISRHESFGLRFFTAILRDATEQEIAAAALRESERRYSEMLANVEMISLMINRESRIIYVNDYLLQLTGWRRDEVIGEDWFTLFVPPENRDLRSVRAALHADAPEARHHENEILTRSGERRLIRWNNTLLRSLSGDIIGSASIGEDITERKRAEDQVRRLNADLERKVEERTAELTEANKELEAFNYSASHDLRSPLNRINGFAQMLEEDCKDKLDAENRRRIQTIRDSAEKMTRLIDDLLDFSRLGRRPIGATKIDMAALAREAMDELTASGASADGWKGEFRLGSMPAAMGDYALIRQVWSNLLANALKFSGGGDSPTIETGGQTVGKENIYFVKDNGAGFDMEYSDKLFRAFQRLHKTSEFPGTGLGLAIVQRIVGRHGGRVWAEGKVGQGATFHFTLPS
jgi:PAS domain S-box-containing protein